MTEARAIVSTMDEKLQKLPVFEHLERVGGAVNEHPVTILTATPGSGKTILVAPHLVKNSDLRIAMLQPRRVAAQRSAQTIAQFNNWKVGDEVGLIMKNVHKKSSSTRLTIMTEGVLSRMLASGDAEKNFDLIILDEFHERSLHTDLACSWIKQQNRVKLLVMSATLDVGPLNDFFPEAQHIDIKGRLYPVEKFYLKRALNFHDRSVFNEKLLELCTHALKNHPEGNILVFLPGRSEIQRAKETLSLAQVEKHHQVEIHTLSSKEKKENQNTALAEDSRRKIILSTNIAETSLTIPNVQVVIDSGLKRESNFNAKTGVQSLSVRRIALDSATQREGRAGRLQEGVCYKMWTSADEQRMRKTTPAEIHRTDPIELITKVMSFGHPLESFEFLEAPEREQWDLAYRRLEISGCIKEGKLTAIGFWVAQFPGDFSSAVLAALSLNQKFLDEALVTVVILQEGDPAPFLSQTPEGERTDDLRSRLQWLKENPGHRYHQLAKKLKQQIEKKPSKLNTLPEIDSLEEAITLAFTHRLCRFRTEKKRRALMSTGRGVSVGKRKIPKNTEFFVALSLMDHRTHGQTESEVNFRFDVSKKTIKKVYEKSIETVTRLETGGKKGEPKPYVYQSLWELPLEEPRGLPLKKSHMIDHFKRRFSEGAREVLKDDFPNSLGFIERANFCRHHNPELGFPEMTEEHWNLIVDAAYSETKERHLEDKDWLNAIKMLFTAAQLGFIESFAPRFIATRTRRQNLISYADTKKPMISIILQEAFEFRESPKIGDGEVTLAIELLTPGRRPIEISQDMARFWQASYPVVRKQFRGRYPKHSWPEKV